MTRTDRTCALPGCDGDAGHPVYANGGGHTAYCSVPCALEAAR